MNNGTRGHLWGPVLFVCALFGIALLTGARQAEAKEITFTLSFDYLCGGSPSSGCNMLNKQLALATFNADDQQVTDLTARSNGGTGILTDFSIAGKILDGTATKVACADGSALKFDPTSLYFNTGGKTYKNGFSCSSITVSAGKFTMTLSSNSFTGGIVFGNAAGIVVTGAFNTGLGGERHTMEFVTVPGSPIVIQNKWDSCQYTGFKTESQIAAKQPIGCVLQSTPGTGYEWTLTPTGMNNGVTTCYALCSVRK